MIDEYIEMGEILQYMNSLGSFGTHCYAAIYHIAIYHIIRRGLCKMERLPMRACSCTPSTP